MVCTNDLYKNNDHLYLEKRRKKMYLTFSSRLPLFLHKGGNKILANWVDNGKNKLLKI